MNPFEKADFREALKSAFIQAINKIGLANFKRTSFFGSNDPAFTAKSVGVLKEAA